MYKLNMFGFISCITGSVTVQTWPNCIIDGVSLANIIVQSCSQTTLHRYYQFVSHRCSVSSYHLPSNKHIHLGKNSDISVFIHLAFLLEIWSAF